MPLTMSTHVTTAVFTLCSCRPSCPSHQVVCSSLPCSSCCLPVYLPIYFTKGSGMRGVLPPQDGCPVHVICTPQDRCTRELASLWPLAGVLTGSVCLSVLASHSFGLSVCLSVLSLSLSLSLYLCCTKYFHPIGNGTSQMPEKGGGGGGGARVLTVPLTEVPSGVPLRKVIHSLSSVWL